MLQIRDKKAYRKHIETMNPINAKRGCLKINLRWPLLFHLRLDSFEFF